MPEADGRHQGDDPFTSVLVGFAHELRTAGLTVGTGDVLTYFAAMTPLDPTDLVDLYWGGRTTLLTRHADQAVYDRVFRQYFLGEDAPARTQLMLSPQSVAEAIIQQGRGGRSQHPVAGMLEHLTAAEPALALGRLHAAQREQPGQPAIAGAAGWPDQILAAVLEHEPGADR